jgi:hypothetical protein
MAPAAAKLLLAEAMVAPPQALGLAMLQADPHVFHLDHASQCGAVTDALADGAATAADHRKRYPTLTPQEIAREMRVTMEMTNDDPMVGSLWRFAEYQSRPPRIVIYNRGLAPLQRISDDDLAALLGKATLQDVFVAHELYHHAEAIRPEVPISRRHQATLFRIGKWRWRTGIAALAEIAAGAFAQALLDLPCHPRVLDFVVVDLVAGARTTNA